MVRKLTILATALAFTAPFAPAETFYNAWSHTFNDQVKASQFPRAIALDKHGHVFVAGHMDVDASRQLYVAKYDALDGHQLWQRIMPESGTNQTLVNALAVDRFGDCVVVGSRNVAGSSIDYYVNKLQGENGLDFWNNGFRTYDGTAGGQDVALKVVTDSSGHVIVTGRSAGSGSGDDIVTLKYDCATGNQLGVTDRYTPSNGTFNDYPGALAVDSADNIIVGGTVASAGSVKRFAVRKLKPNLTAAWTIVPINKNGEGGVTGLAVDSGNNVIATGMAQTADGRFGYYTTKLSSAMGEKIWATEGVTPVSSDSFGNPRPAPIGVVVGPDDCPIVSGTLRGSGGRYYVQTVKYTSGGFSGNASTMWSGSAGADSGLGVGDTFATALQTDGDSNAIVVGSTVNVDGDADVYVAKFAGTDGARTWSGSVGNLPGFNDTAVGVAIDRLGHLAVLADLSDEKNGNANLAYHEFGTLKLNRFNAIAGDALPDQQPGVPDNATFALGNPPALADNGSIAAKITLASGAKRLGAILFQGPGGADTFPAVQGQDAPGANGGASPGKWVSFSDPVIAPEGTYAFSARLTGAPANATGLWTNSSGALRLVLQSGQPLPGAWDPSAKVISIVSYSMRNSDLLALLRVSGSPATSSVLLRLADDGTATMLLRSGKTGPTLNGKLQTIRSFTVLSPSATSPGDGRWEGDGSVIVRAVCAQADNPRVVQTALLRINTASGMATVLTATGQPAAEVASGAVYKTFGLPAVSDGGNRFAFAATVAPVPGVVTAASDSALIYAYNGGFNHFGREGGSPGDISLLNTTFAAFSDPVISQQSSGPMALFLATIRGSGVNAANNRVLMYGDPTTNGGPKLLARTSQVAAQPVNDLGGATEPLTKYSAFLSFALSGGSEGSPLFVATLSGATPRNNLALFARDSSGGIRRLLRTGDELGGGIVRTINLLKAVPPAFAAARSFNGTRSVVVQVAFTNGKTALLPIAIP